VRITPNFAQRNLDPFVRTPLIANGCGEHRITRELIDRTSAKSQAS
jgi:hypothetical protein